MDNYLNVMMLIFAGVLIVGAVAFAMLGWIPAIVIGLLCVAGAAWFVLLVMPPRSGDREAVVSLPRREMIYCGLSNSDGTRDRSVTRPAYAPS